VCTVLNVSDRIDTMVPSIGSVCVFKKSPGWFLINCEDERGSCLNEPNPKFMTILSKQLVNDRVIVMFPDGRVYKVSRYFVDDSIFDVISS
jgi:hypothetical protein